MSFLLCYFLGFFLVFFVLLFFYFMFLFLVGILFFFKFFGTSFGLSSINFFHDFNCYLLVYILIFILCLFFFMIMVNGFKMNLILSQIEMKCCFYPMLILFFQLLPSLFIFWEENFFLKDIMLTVKVLGHQWYWSYELGDMLNFSFDSYMKDYEILILGDLCFLEVDNRLVLPVDTNIRFVLTSSDVIHAWGLLNWFIKMDVMSGIMSVFNYDFNLLGLFYGQCSEICGTNHSFMPIVVELVLFDFFKGWLFCLF